MSEFNILKLSIKDYLTKDILRLILYPLIGSAIVLYMIFFTVADMGLSSLENTHIQIEQHQMQIANGNIEENNTTQSYTGSGILDFLLQYTITSWIVSFLVYTIGLFAIGYLSIFVSLVIVGFLTPKILGIIHQRHYEKLQINSNFSAIDGIWKIVKTAFVMILIFLALLPLYFIPIVNIIAINLPFYYFFHKMLHYDVGSTLTSKEEFIQVYYSEKSTMRLRTLFLYIVSLIPFVAFFIAVFYIVYLGHTYFIKLNKLKGEVLLEE